MNQTYENESSANQSPEGGCVSQVPPPFLYHTNSNANSQSALLLSSETKHYGRQSKANLQLSGRKTSQSTNPNEVTNPALAPGDYQPLSQQRTVSKHISNQIIRVDDFTYVHKDMMPGSMTNLNHDRSNGNSFNNLIESYHKPSSNYLVGTAHS